MRRVSGACLPAQVARLPGRKQRGQHPTLPFSYGMSEQHDDPLRSDVHVFSREAASPITAASHASPSAPFMTPGSAEGPPDVQQHQGTVSSRAASRQTGPRSSYFMGPPGKDSAFGTAPVGVIGRDKPREIVRCGYCPERACDRNKR